ncbi:MAG: HAMP domain-containing histidine kinase [Chitinophagaceae bacterium]|nr:HAMP domain-containing histidine kinase [Chitinophagaceae bacterium]
MVLFPKRKQLVYLVVLGFVVMILVQLALLSNAYKGKEKDFNDRLFYVVRIFEDHLLRDTLSRDRQANDSTALRFVQTDLQKQVDSVFRKNDIPPSFVYAVGKFRTGTRRLGADTNLIWSSAPQYNEGLKATKLRIANFASGGDNTYFMKIFLPEKPTYLLRSLLPLIIILLLTVLALFACFLGLSAIIQKQARLAELKNDFINNMTHELKTPLFTISIASKMLAEQALTKENPKYASYVSSIQQETGRLTKLVDKVLQASSLEKKQLALDMKSVDLHEAIHAAVKSLELIRTTQQAVLKLSLQAAHHQIYADETHIESVMFSLLDNAFKYSNGPADILISTRNENGNIVLTIADKGIGLDAANRQLVFERFFRAHTGDLHEVKGYGIGLSYVKSVIEAHNGSVRVESKLSEGSQFILTLPCYPDGG